MSQSRLNHPESRARSYLLHPIEYRKVLHNRHDHHPSSPPSRIPAHHKPTQSRLERLINLDHARAHSKTHERQLSLSHSQAHSRNNATPLDRLSSPNEGALQRKDSLSGVRVQPPRTPAPTAGQQKLSLKQQNRRPPAPPPSIEELTERMNSLVTRKLQLMSECLQGKGGSEQRKKEVNCELQHLLELMRGAEGMGSGEVRVLNQKIAFIETLMAEQNVEAEMMKKHYYHLSSSKIKGKVGDFNHQRTKVAAAFNSLKNNSKLRQSAPKEESKKPLFKETTNKSSYKQPKSSDYESYRYKQNLATLNPQPLPRSSYKRDFLYLKSLPDQKIVNRDHSPYFPSSKTRVGSTYGQDYRRLKTETIDHRELDAYRDKIRTLKVSYMPQRRSEPQVQDIAGYRQAAISRVRSNNSQIYQNEEPGQSRRLLLSESRRQFQGEVAFEPSRIKHQQLQSFQYKLKHLFKA